MLIAGQLERIPNLMNLIKTVFKPTASLSLLPLRGQKRDLSDDFLAQAGVMRRLYAQTAEVDRHPEVRLFHRRQKKMFQSIRDQYGTIPSRKGTPVYDRLQQARRDHRNTKRQRGEELLKEVIARYK